MDKRVYDGQPSDELQAHLDYVQSKLAELQKKVPEACVTYFPMEGKWHAHVWEKSISGMCHSKLEAIIEALKAL